MDHSSASVASRRPPRTPDSQIFMGNRLSTYGKPHVSQDSSSVSSLLDRREKFQKRACAAGSVSFDESAMSAGWRKSPVATSRQRRPSYSTPERSKSPTWSYQPQKGFQAEDAEACRLRMAENTQNSTFDTQANQSPGSCPANRSPWFTWGTRAARDDNKTTPFVAHSSGKMPRRDSLFTREPQFCRHVCVFYLLILLLVGFRMASEPSRLVSERLARAKAMNQ